MYSVKQVVKWLLQIYKLFYFLSNNSREKIKNIYMYMDNDKIAMLMLSFIILLYMLHYLNDNIDSRYTLIPLYVIIVLSLLLYNYYYKK